MSTATWKKMIKQGTVISHGNGESIFKFYASEAQSRPTGNKQPTAAIHGKKDGKQK